jgi:putative ABC transport system permease protein
VAGVIDYSDQSLFIINLDTVLAELAKKNNYTSAAEYVSTVGFQQLYVKVKDPKDIKPVAQQIRDLGYDAQTLEDILALFNTFFSIIPIIFSIVGIIAVVVASIGIINTMVMAVFERTKEIGVMKAIGARNIHILELFVVESGMIGFLGGTMASIICISFMWAIQSVIINNILPRLNVQGIDTIFVTPVWLVIITILFSTLVGIIAGLYPAIRASKLNPVNALRYE